MASLETIRAAADFLGFETEYKPPLLTVRLIFRIWLQVMVGEDGTKTRLKYGPYPEWLWDVISCVPLVAAGYYFIAAKRLGRETLVVVGFLFLLLASYGAIGVLVGRRRRQLLQRAHQLETTNT